MTIVSKLLNRARFPRNGAKIQLLSRQGCHLCDNAFDALRHSFDPAKIEIVDITNDPALEELYVFRIPVVLYNGEVFAEGNIGRTEARSARNAIERQVRSEGSWT